ncbi:hypothetical protein K4A83_05900 [Spirulina subsalsa FACHB-351]|uniref:Uncharacterized protein n=1 Tax=Spirulina subsalsa FACHB-351 TaxID=234711 RepID=A0ABT3L2S0_9CYAN|nr:hypothetical protein [Spirulina subsalsa]MCW6035806.1 hypothetical protein [Spirulina subsalsa FACHB-351]
MIQTASQTRLNSTAPALVAYNPQTISYLNRAIALALGEPGFILAHCDNLHLRRDIIQDVVANPTLQVEVLTLHPSVTQLFSTLEGALSQPHPDVVMILGLESVVDLEAFWGAANLMREQLKVTFPFPLVFWVNDPVLRQLRRVAPDLANQAPPALRMEGG